VKAPKGRWHIAWGFNPRIEPSNRQVEPLKGAQAERATMAATCTNLLYHIVFSTKHRRPIIAPSLQGDLYSYIGGIIRGEGGVLLKKHGIEYDEQYLWD